MELEIRKTETYLGHECLKAMFSFPHPASLYDPTDKRRCYAFIEVIKDGVEDTKINIIFNRFNMGLLDVLLALKNENLISAMREDRFAGYVPLIQTPYESQLIYDYRHDEAHAPNNEEPQSAEEDENEEEQIRVAD